MSHYWTGYDANGGLYSLRSDHTCWTYTGSWVQVTNATTIATVLWQAVSEGAAAANAAPGFTLGAAESGAPPPPPPP